MKASKYNLFFKEEGLLFNAVTCGLAQVLPENTDLIEKVLDDPNRDNLSSLDPDIEKKLIEGGFLIEEDVNELAFLEARYRLTQFAPGILSLTIVPTLDCNFNCIYCYEEKSKATMQKSVVEGIVSFIQSQKGLKELAITWYGGEPLLQQDVIFSISEEIVNYCDANNINFKAGMVTNGYLLNYSLSKLLSEKAKVKWLQITLDGPPNIHDQRRSLKGGEGTFDKIVSNVVAAIDLFKIIVRVNIDKNNFQFFPDLIDILRKLGLQGKISIGPGRVLAPTLACKDYVSNCFSSKTFAKLQFKFYETLFASGFLPLVYPQPVTIPCIAVSPNFFAIDPNGKIHKCWETVGMDNEVVGDIRNPNLLSSNLIKWLNYSPFDIEKCKRCKFLPICMGSCPYHQIQRPSWLRQSDNCTRWKYSLKDFLLYAAKTNTLKSENRGE